MASIGHRLEEFHAELDALGIDEVRLRLARGLYNERVGEKGPLAREWLQRKELAAERESEARRDALQTEQASAASRAADAAARAVDAAERSAEAAERQATTAERASRIATAALVIAIISGIASIVSLFRSK